MVNSTCEADAAPWPPDLTHKPRDVRRRKKPRTCSSTTPLLNSSSMSEGMLRWKAMPYCGQHMQHTHICSESVGVAAENLRV